MDFVALARARDRLADAISLIAGLNQTQQSDLKICSLRWAVSVGCFLARHWDDEQGGAGRARHSVRAVLCPFGAGGCKTRRAEDCSPYLSAHGDRPEQRAADVSSAEPVFFRRQDAGSTLRFMEGRLSLLRMHRDHKLISLGRARLGMSSPDGLHFWVRTLIVPARTKSFHLRYQRPLRAHA